MVDYESDAILSDVHDEMYQKEQSRPSSAFTKLSSQSKFFIGMFIAALILLVFLEKIEIKLALIIAGAGAVLLFILMSEDPKRQELTYIECMIRLNDLLRFLQKHPIGPVAQIPKGKYHIEPIGRKQWYEGQAFKRSSKVTLHNKKTGIREMYFIEQDVYTGDIITFQWKPDGVYGNETKDIKLMPSRGMMLDRKSDQYMGKKISQTR